MMVIVMTEKRYEVETEGFQVSIKDNISKTLRKIDAITNGYGD